MCHMVFKNIHLGGTQSHGLHAGDQISYSSTLSQQCPHRDILEREPTSSGDHKVASTLSPFLQGHMTLIWLRTTNEMSLNCSNLLLCSHILHIKSHTLSPSCLCVCACRSAGGLLPVGKKTTMKLPVNVTFHI